MEPARKHFIKYLFIIIFILSSTLVSQDFEKKLAEFDSLSIQDTIPDISRRDSLFQTVDSTLLLNQKELDSLKAFYDSLKTSVLKQKTDSLYLNFMEGVQNYREHKFFKALTNFQTINAVPIKENKYKIASHMMLVKTNLRLGKISRALSLGYEFETKFTNSSYLDDIRYSIARALFNQKDYSQSLLYYLQVVKQFDDPQLAQKCIEEMNTLVDIFITINQLEKLKETIDDDFYKPYIMLKLAEKYHERNQSWNANKYLLAAYQYRKNNKFLAQQYKQTRKYLEEVHKEKIYIGVILPLSGPRSEVAEPILNGVKFAIDEMKSHENFNIAAIIMDNQGDFIRSVKQAQILVENPKVKAIFGPLSSENTIGVGGVANQARLPFITPTATNSRITELGGCGFQANVDFDNLGRFLGKYCIEETQTKTLFTLSPGGDFGTEMTDAFSKTVDKGGIKLLTQKWYSGTPDNLEYHFNDIRKIGVEIAEKNLNQKVEVLRDSLHIVMSKDSSWLTHAGFQIFPADSEHYEVYHNDKMYLLNTKNVLTVTGLMDSTEFEIPDPTEFDDKINTIDAVFAPVKSNNLEMIISQLDYYNIYARVLGNADWNNIEKLRQNRSLLDSMIIITDYYINNSSREYQSFRRKYNATMGNIPRRFDLYGYDSIQPILKGIMKGNTNRNTLQKYFYEMPVYQGIARNISFNGQRPGVNCCAYILSFRNNRIEPVAEIIKGEIHPIR
ncbi:MAG: ABC transporter substrate-binding protein [Candidatus Marinimicrobia bacterium]|nr:ABC transporter substrate-binding protein [Candidatus Neomarinimicrobiota bacterium]